MHDSRHHRWLRIGMIAALLPCLGIIALLAQSRQARTFPDSPYLRIDPEKIVGATRCGECHARERDVWNSTMHQTQFNELHRSEQAQGILDRMGFRLAKRESLCLRCHYTAEMRGDEARAVSGVSCESCHGAARDWVNVHNDYGGATHDTESAEHRADRIRLSEEGGMLRPSGDLYAVAANCFECHTVPDERLINEGGHPSGSDFHLAAWSDSIRHNFLAAQWSANTENREQTAERTRLMFVIGAMLDYEYGLRGMAMATTRSPYAKAMERRVKVAYRALRGIAAAVDLPELEDILEVAEGVDLAPGRREPLTAAADQVSSLARAFGRAHDGAGLGALDPVIAGESVPVAIESPQPNLAAGPERSDAVADGSEVEAHPEASETAGPAIGAAPAPTVSVGQIRSRPAWFPDDRYETTVPGCSCHTQAQSWLLDDPHSRSLDLMNTARAEQIASIYGLTGEQRLLGNQICMNCHGTVISGDEAYEAFDPVSCESCHGPSSGYLKPHERGGGAGFELGMRRLKEADARAANCARCHHVTDERLLAAGHTSGDDWNFTQGVTRITHWPDTKNVNRTGAYPELAPASLASALSAVKSGRPVPRVQIVDVVPAPATPVAAPPRSGGAQRATTGEFSAPRTTRFRPVHGPVTLDLPPLPDATDSTSTEDLLLLVKRRIERLYEALGRTN